MIQHDIGLQIGTENEDIVIYIPSVDIRLVLTIKQVTEVIRLLQASKEVAKEYISNL